MSIKKTIGGVFAAFLLMILSVELSGLLASGLVALAGTLSGIMFSLIAVKTGSVWNSGIVHAIWNIIIVGGSFFP